MTDLIAQRVLNPALSGISGLTGSAFFSLLFPTLIAFALVVGVIIFVFYLLWGGVSWITAGGDKVALEAAKGRITNAIVGLIVLLMFFGLLNFFECFFGIGLKDISVGQFNISFSGAPFCPSSPGGPPPPIPTPPPPGVGTPTPTPISAVIINQNSNTTCTSVCNAAGYSTCIRIGTDSLGTDTIYRRGAAGTCWNTQGDLATNGCSTVMVATGIGDPGFPGRTCDWTNCNCGGTFTPSATPTSSPTPTPPVGNYFYTINLRGVCPGGTVSTENTTAYFILWPPNPETVTYDSLAPGTHTLNINAPSTGAVYVGLASQVEGIAGTSQFTFPALLPLPHSNMDTGQYFTEQRWAVHWWPPNSFGIPSVPSGTYNIDFQAPPSLCGVPPGQIGSACTTNSQCASAFCSNSQDVDGDGYYQAYIGGTGTCQNGPADCNDANANVHPNQTQYFETAISGTDFNYDCADSDGNGDPNDRWPTLNCLAAPRPYPSCQTTPFTQSQISAYDGWEGSIPSCGQTLTSDANRFTKCKASADSVSCTTPWANTGYGCDLPCATGNVCGNFGNQQCTGWTIEAFILFPSHVGGRTRMPCK